MHHTSLFIRGISFLLMISLFLQPLYGHQQYDTPVENTLGLSQFKYDDIVQYLSELENGNFEGFCSIKEHEAINSWLINMALAGTASDDVDVYCHQLIETRTCGKLNAVNRRRAHGSIKPIRGSKACKEAMDSWTQKRNSA